MELIDLLIKFRTQNIGIITDIQKAFLQVFLSNNDRSVVQFLRCERMPICGEELQPIVSYQAMRVSFSMTSSPFLLAATLQHHLKNVLEQFTKTADAIRSQLYIDDPVTGVDSGQEARGSMKRQRKS